MARATRPQAAEAADQEVERTRVSVGDGRLATVIHDFFLPPAERLAERERALMTGMLHGLVGLIADEIRVRLPDPLAIACECPVDELVAELSAAGLLARTDLMALLLRRADMVGIAQTSAGMGVAPGAQLIQQWTRDEDDGVADAAMAVVLGRASAADAYGQPSVDLADCPAELAVALGYSIAAALALRAGGNCDGEMTAAAVELLARHDEGRRLEALEERLILALERAGRLEAATLLALAGRGEAGLLAQALARLSGIPFDSAWNLVAAPGGGRLALLLRMAEQPRPAAASLFAALGDAIRLGDPAAEIGRFDELTEEQVSAARTRFRLPQDYQDALRALEAHGQRAR